MSKKKITLTNISSFIEGNVKFLLDVFDLYPLYKKEQVLWRLNICKDDCVKNKECEYCGCPPTKKAFVEHSCNNGDRFPDMMDEETWEKYKKENSINVEDFGI